MIKILIDCFGGDHSPEANVDGALAAIEKMPDLYLILTGDEGILQNYLKGKTYDSSRLEIVHAPEVIGCEERVIRPAFCPILPTMDGGIVGICDSGANVEVTPEHLRQFAIMSSLYMKYVYNIENPRIALLNVGKEAEKGDEIRQKAHILLRKKAMKSDKRHTFC